MKHCSVRLTAAVPWNFRQFQIRKKEHVCNSKGDEPLLQTAKEGLYLPQLDI